MLKENQEKKELLLIKDLGMIYPNENSKYKRKYGLYKCYCGVEFRANQYDVKTGHTTSCGCFHKQKLRERNSLLKSTHGKSKEYLYKVWFDMKRRCYSEKSKDFFEYNGRGITICDEWLDVDNFISDMKDSYSKGLKIDRINNNLGYSKDNCRWVSQNIQSRNTRILRKTNTSGYRGVTFHKKQGKFHSKICVNSKTIHIGTFPTAIEAAKAYDKYVISNNLEHTINGVCH